MALSPLLVIYTLNLAHLILIQTITGSIHSLLSLKIQFRITNSTFQYFFSNGCVDAIALNLIFK